MDRDSPPQSAKALFVVPLKALVEEKAVYFETLLAGSGLVVQRYMHGYGVLPMPRVMHVAVCTNEKASIIIQSMAAGMLACAAHLSNSGPYMYRASVVPSRLVPIDRAVDARVTRGDRGPAR